MPFYFFIWDEENEEHIAQHGVTVEDFEEIVQHPQRLERSRSSQRYIAFGYTASGEYLACVYELFDEMQVYPVTAYEPE